MAKIDLTFVPLRTLPPALTKEIGRAIVAYARLEWLLSEMTYMVLNLEPAEGRIAVGQPRATDRFARLCELAKAKKLPSTTTNLNGIRDVIEECQRRRDQIAHGVWCRSPRVRGYVLAIFRGTWQPNPKLGKTSRMIVPEGIRYGPSDARMLVSMIGKVTKALTRWGDEITPHLTSLETRHVRSRGTGRAQG